MSERILQETTAFGGWIAQPMRGAGDFLQNNPGLLCVIGDSGNQAASPGPES